MPGRFTVIITVIVCISLFFAFAPPGLDESIRAINLHIEQERFSLAFKTLAEARKQFGMRRELDEVEKKLIVRDYKQTYLNNIHLQLSELGWTGDTATCDPGSISEVAISRSLQILNYFRRLAGIGDSCTFNDSLNKYCQSAALLMYANNILTHYPEKNIKCYSEEAAYGARVSNLSGGTSASGPYAIKRFMDDEGEDNYSVGHRRWILNPYNNVFGVGITPRCMALGVIGKFTEYQYFIGKEKKNINYIAWPRKGYFPKQLVPRRWSFSLDGAQFDEAEVTVFEIKDNKKISVQVNKEPVYNGYGLNTLVWIPYYGGSYSDSLRVLEVHISKVKLQETYRTFTYLVKLIDCT